MKRFINFILAGFLSLSSLLLMPVPTAMAAVDTCTWNGSVSDSWANGDNWSVCDNGGVPENGDNLVFDNSSANITSTNDISGLTLANVSFIGSSPTNTTEIGSGLTFSIDYSLDIDASNVTIANNIIFNNLDSGDGIRVNTTGLTNIEISSNLTLNSPIGHAFAIDLKSDVYHGGAMLGATSYLVFGNLGTDYSAAWQTSDSVASTFTAPFVLIFQGTYTCQLTGCFGDSANFVATPNNAGNNGQIEFSQTGDTGIAVGNVLSIYGSSNQIIQHAGTTTLNNDVVFNSGGTVANIDITLDGTNSKPAVIVSNAFWNMNNNTMINISGSGALSSIVELNGTAAGSGGMNVDHSVLYLNPTVANTYTGVTTAQANGGILVITEPTSLGDVSGGTVVETGGQLELAAGADTTFDAEPLTVSGAGPDGTESAIHAFSSFIYNLPGHITLAGNSTFGGVINSIITMTGAVSGTGDLTLDGADISTIFNFNAATANTYSGTTTVINGVLNANNATNVIAIPHDLVINDSASVALYAANQISTDSQVTINSSGGFYPALTVHDNTQIKALNGSATSFLIIPTGSTLTIASTTTPSIFSGILNGEGSLVQSSGPNAPLTLSGVSDGDPRNITSNAGVLIMNGDYTYSTVDINSGATLKGTGTVGNTTVAAGGTLSIGNSPGCMSIAGLLTLTAASTYTQEIASATPCIGYDVATVAGSATLGNATLNIVPSYTPNVGQVFTILTSEFIVGIYNGLPDNSLVTVNGLTFRINYTATTVTLTFVSGTLNPSPLAPTGQNSNQTALLAFAVLAVALAGLGLEYGTRRRKHNAKV